LVLSQKQTYIGNNTSEFFCLPVKKVAVNNFWQDCFL